MTKDTITRGAFAQRLINIRKSNGLTQRELEKISGLSYRMIAHYETVATNPPANAIIQLAKALKVSTDELMGHKHIKEKEPINRRVFKKAKILDELSPDNQKIVMKFIDALHKSKK